MHGFISILLSLFTVTVITVILFFFIGLVLLVLVPYFIDWYRAEK